MRPLEIADGIYDVGIKDWNIRDFHGYSTYQGTTYNSFLIMDEKIVLIDTVKREFKDEFIKNISKIVDPKKIDMVISNHAEPDHSGSLPFVMHLIGEEKPVYCSKMGAKALSAHYGTKLNLQVAENVSEMSIGKRTLQFLETRMLHWPDSMFTYVREDKILFSSDAFGQHYAGPENYDDEVGETIMPHAKKYYANILLPFSAKVEKLLQSVEEMGLKPDMICPDHGIYWRQDPGKIINAYKTWSAQKPIKKAVVIYDTMWQSTEKMARAITAGINSEGVSAVPMHIRKWHRSDIMTEVLDAGAVIIGSPTLNNGIFPTVSDVMTYMKGLKPKNKIGGAFGSYGWSGEAVRIINAEIETMGFNLIDAGQRVTYVPETEDIEACFEYGKRIAAAVKEAHI